MPNPSISASFFNISLLIVLGSTAASARAALPEYSIRKLPLNFRPMALTATAEVIGIQAGLAGDRVLRVDAFGNSQELWTPSQLQGFESWALGDDGAIIGASYSPTSPSLPVVVRTDGTSQSLNLPAELAGRVEVRSLRGNDTAMGVSGVENRFASTVVWHGSTSTVVDRFEGFGVGTRGEVLGKVPTMQRPGSPGNAAMWSDGAIRVIAADEFNLPGYLTSTAIAMNTSGELLIQVDQLVNGRFRTRISYVLDSNDNLHRLANPYNSDSMYAMDINDKGAAVGYVSGYTASDVSIGAHAILWKDGVAHSLEDYVDGVEGWTLERADRINFSGVIVGSGLFDGETRGFMLTPIVVPEPCCLTVSSLVFFGLTRRRR